MSTHIRELEDATGDVVDVLYYCSAGCYRDHLTRAPGLEDVDGGESPCSVPEHEDGRPYVYCAECGVRLNGPDTPVVVNLIGRRYGPDGIAIPVRDAMQPKDESEWPHWHVATGLAGYGPDGADADFGRYNVRQASDVARDELSAFSDMAGELAESLAEEGRFEEAWNERKRSDSLELMRANLSNDRASAPLYNGRPGAWNDALAFIFEETFPLDVSSNTRLYVWVCDEDDCEHGRDDNV